MNPQRIGLATYNPHKIKEIRKFLNQAGISLDIITAVDVALHLPEETGDTFRDNARAKALAFARWIGWPALADDSGLVVPALEGFPGVHSARWGQGQMSQAEKNAWIIARLEGRPSEDRKAFFVCALAFADEERILWETEVWVEGVISDSPRGTGGFGYDPIFYYPPRGKTFAEMTLEEKNEVSHRGRALRAWVEFLKRWLGR